MLKKHDKRVLVKPIMVFAFAALAVVTLAATPSHKPGAVDDAPNAKITAVIANSS
jgi:hypothetical protein